MSYRRTITPTILELAGRFVVYRPAGVGKDPVYRTFDRPEDASAFRRTIA